MKKITIFTFAAMLMVQGAWAQKAWTLDECISYALEHNISLQKAHLTAASAGEDVKGAHSALFPSLSASTNHSVGYRPWQDNKTATVTNGQVNTKVEKNYYNGSYGINAQWTVWNGNKLVNTLRQNKLTAKQAELNEETTANSIQEKIAELYIKILYLSEAINVNEQTLETSKKNEQRGMAMLEVGKMSKADVAQLSAQRATDEYNLVKARTDIATNKLQLKQLLELDGNTAFDVFIPTTTDDHALDEIPSVQSVYEQALMSRPEIASKEMDIENKGIGIKVAKAGYMPTISMTGGVGTSTNSLSNTAWGNQFKTNFDASAGVSVAIPIYDKRQAKTAVNKARIARQQAQLDLQAQQKELYKSIETYWLNAETNQQKFRSAITAVQSEQQSFDLLQEQFNLGLKNIVELMAGKDKLLKAQQNKLESKYQTILAQQMLKFYSGSRPLN